MAFDSSGNLFAAGYGNGSIYKFTKSGTLSSTPTTFASGLSNPTALAFDSLGNLFATKYDNSQNTSSIIEFDNTRGLSSTPSTFATGLGGEASLAFGEVPEPSDYILTGVGMLALLCVGKFRRRVGVFRS